MYIVGFSEVLGSSGKIVHCVEYARSPADSQRSTTVARIDHLRPKEDTADEQVLGHWSIIGPAYEAWLEGAEMPVNGTPLSAWSQLGPAQVKALQAGGQTTIESVAEMNDSAMSRVQLPDVRKLRDAARQILATRDEVDVIAELQNRDEQLAELKAQIEALTASKPKRGRPKKAPETVPEETISHEGAAE